MTQDDLIEMWHKAWPNKGSYVRASAQDLEAFAKLVEAKAIVEENNRLRELFIRHTELAVIMAKAEERERLAKVFDARNTGTGFYEPHEPAQIIRGEA